MINEEVKSELQDMSNYYCSDICESRDKNCDNCPVEGFLIWLDTQTE
jgi:endonuclease III